MTDIIILDRIIAKAEAQLADLRAMHERLKSDHRRLKSDKRPRVKKPLVKKYMNKI